MKRLLASIAAIAALTACGGPPDAVSYDSLSELAMDVHEAGVDCLSAFDMTEATAKIGANTSVCDDSEVAIATFKDHWDRSAFIQMAKFEVLAGPNWIIVAPPSTLDHLQSEIGGDIWNQGRMGRP